MAVVAQWTVKQDLHIPSPSQLSAKIGLTSGDGANEGDLNKTATGRYLVFHNKQWIDAEGYVRTQDGQTYIFHQGLGWVKQTGTINNTSQRSTWIGVPPIVPLKAPAPGQWAGTAPGQSNSPALSSSLLTYAVLFGIIGVIIWLFFR